MGKVVVRKNLAKLLAVVCTLAVLLVIAGCSSVDTKKVVSGTWKVESVKATGGGLSFGLNVDTQVFTLEVKEDGSAMLKSSLNEAAVNCTWKENTAKKSTNDTIFILFHADAPVFNTSVDFEAEIDVSASTMVISVKDASVGSLDVTFKKMK